MNFSRKCMKTVFVSILCFFVLDSEFMISSYVEQSISAKSQLGYIVVSFAQKKIMFPANLLVLDQGVEQHAVDGLSVCLRCANEKRAVQDAVQVYTAEANPCKSCNIEPARNISAKKNADTPI